MNAYCERQMLCIQQILKTKIKFVGIILYNYYNL